jgi:hypothetical protein
LHVIVIAPAFEVLVMLRLHLAMFGTSIFGMSIVGNPVL